MNKVISTQDRVFMAVGGPSGCGKTEIIFKMLIADTFYPKFNNIIFLYREMQEIYIKMEKTLGVSFKKYANLEILNSLANCLLIIVDSCGEICNGKEFVKLATAGRHKNINVIYIKHNIYQQSKWSRTIDLNTTHIILFKSSRDIQRVEFLGKQLKPVKSLKLCYQLATKEPFGHLLIDLDPKTSDCLRYCSNITEPGPSVFYLPSDKAETTPLNNAREKIIYSEANGAFAAQTAKEIFA